ncbi:lysine--tRNA ligase [bacterium]|nr:MAG: lysine--tRNA ligase [bacterium]
MIDEKNLTTATHSEHAEPKEHEIRVEKVKQMRAAQIEPWPSFEPVTATTEQALVDFQKTSDETKQFSLAGRLMIIRDHGKTFFARLQDRDGQLQLYIKKDIVGDQSFEHFCKDIDLGDIVWVTGTLFNTKTGEVTMRVETFKLLSKCLHPLPEKYHGLVDVEHRYRQRYLDLMSNPESREKFKKRSGIVQAIRRFLQDQDFMEVETPMLHPIPGGAAARPFVTHHNAYDMQLFLRIAPELYLKQLVVGGFERVFEINRNFRNEGVSTKHNPEFTMLEFYMAHGDYHTGMALTEKLIQHAVLQNFDSLIIDYQGNKLDFTAPFRRLSIKDSLIEIGGLKPEQITEENIDQTIKELNVHVPGKPNYGMKIFGLFEECVEAKIVQPTFIISYPLEVSPLAKRDPQDPTIAARFELFAMSMELSNGFTELNDPFDQAERFRAQVQARTDGDSEAHHYDADFIKALEYGLPPTVGVGIGIDRLVMLLTNTNSIKDVILFPTMKKAAHKE